MAGWFGPFRLERRVGRGGLGAVWRAVDTRTNSTVALKILPVGIDPKAAERTLREFSLLRKVSHPNLVRLLDAGQLDKTPWLSMELIEGLGIREWLTIAGAPIPLEPEPGEGAHGSEGVDLDALYDEPDSAVLIQAARARHFTTIAGVDQQLDLADQTRLNMPARLTSLCDALAQISDGLTELHARELVHRDVKPGNILVTPEHRAVLVDFGLVKRQNDEQETAAGRVVGTMRYMAPEQARGEHLDGRTDIYSLGATLYELLAGRPPFPYESQMQVMEAVMGEMPTDIPAINPGAPIALCVLAHRMLAKAKESRPASAREVGQVLRAVGSRVSRA